MAETKTKKYTIILKYRGYPELKIETEAISDTEAMKHALDKVHQQQPNLKNLEPDFQTTTSSDAPY